MGRDSVVSIAPRYGLDGPGLESQLGSKIFRNRPERPWGPPSLLYKGYRAFLGVKATGTWRQTPAPSNTEVKERVGLDLYSPSPLWAFLACSSVKFTFTFTIFVSVNTTCAIRNLGACLWPTNMASLIPNC